MSSGDSLAIIHPYNNEAPASDYATLDTRNSHPVLDFADGTPNESAVFSGVIPNNYDGGGIDVELYIGMGTATSGTVVVGLEMENMTDTDLDSDSFATQIKGTLVVSGTTGVYLPLTISLTDGAQMDSVAAGEPYRIRVTRLTDDSEDSAGGDMEILSGHIAET